MSKLDEVSLLKTPWRDLIVSLDEPSLTILGILSACDLPQDLSDYVPELLPRVYDDPKVMWILGNIMNQEIAQKIEVSKIYKTINETKNRKMLYESLVLIYQISKFNNLKDEVFEHIIPHKYYKIQLLIVDQVIN